MREISRTIVCAVLVSADRKVLLGRKKPKGGGVYSDCWHIPGGGIEPQESREEALRREVLEEVGIDIRDCEVSLLRDTENGSAVKRLPDGEEVLCRMDFLEYLVAIPSPATAVGISLSDDLCNAAWFNRPELDALTLVPAGKSLFTQFAERIFGCS